MSKRCGCHLWYPHLSWERGSPYPLIINWTAVAQNGEVPCMLGSLCSFQWMFWGQLSKYTQRIHDKAVTKSMTKSTTNRQQNFHQFGFGFKQKCCRNSAANCPVSTYPEITECCMYRYSKQLTSFTPNLFISRKRFEQRDPQQSLLYPSYKLHLNLFNSSSLLLNLCIDILYIVQNILTSQARL